MLLPIEHPHRLRSAEEAARFFKGLGAKRVSARGFHTAALGRIQAVVAALPARGETRVSFEGGVLTPRAMLALESLIQTKFQYLDVTTTDANLRVWPWLRSWVHVDRPRNAAEAVLGKRLGAGKNELGEITLTVDDAGPGYPLFLEAESIEPAFDFFRRITSTTVKQGFIIEARPDPRGALLQFLSALGTKVNASLELELPVAQALAAAFPGERLDWQADGVDVDFPEGRIHGFLVTPKVEEGDKERWITRVEKALRRSKLL
jgi:hypothetical protein